MESFAAIMAGIVALSEMVTKLVAEHDATVAAKDKEITDLKIMVAQLKEPPK